MITFVATFLAILAAAAVILGGWLVGGFVQHQLREASRVDGRPTIPETNNRKQPNPFRRVGLMWIERPTHAAEEEATHWHAVEGQSLTNQ